jgi:hypothetical protein
MSWAARTVAESCASTWAFHVDSAAHATFAQVDATVLVTLLVVASLIQIGSYQQEKWFSLKVAETWRRSTMVLVLLRISVFLAGVATCASLVGMTVDSDTLGLVTLGMTVINVMVFAVTCLLCIRWFWGGEPGG